MTTGKALWKTFSIQYSIFSSLSSWVPYWSEEMLKLQMHAVEKRTCYLGSLKLRLSWATGMQSSNIYPTYCNSNLICFSHLTRFSKYSASYDEMRRQPCRCRTRMLAEQRGHKKQPGWDTDPGDNWPWDLAGPDTSARKVGYVMETMKETSHLTTKMSGQRWKPEEKSEYMMEKNGCLFFPKVLLLPPP